MGTMGGDGGGRRRSSGARAMKFLCAGFLAVLAMHYFTGATGGSKGAAADNNAQRCELDSYDHAATTELDLKHCKFTTVPESIAKFHHLIKLDVSHNSLLSLPVLPPTIETLFALGNPFETIPPSVAGLPKLRMLSFKSCRLRRIGDVALPPTLNWLILTENMLTSVPDSFGQLTRMRKLMLANNLLGSVPETMAQMRELELLRLANNRLVSIPDWLLALPSLTWLAIAGNPCVASAPARSALETVKFGDLELGAKLGEGTSSTVREATLRGMTVAVKLYKAELSSDGKNLDEVRASCAVDHPNVLRWLGYLEEGVRHSGEVARGSSAGAGWRLVGVLEWAPGFSSLGKPPSMDTVTRDTYAQSSSFSGAEIREIAVGICHALEHLHARRLSHGDVYAHNILWRRGGGGTVAAAVAPRRPHLPEDGGVAEAEALVGDDSGGSAAMAKLSDFGAAFYYGTLPSEQRVHFERMEQRAFGFLLEELLARHDGVEPPRMLSAVRAVATAATSATPADRPGFAALARMLTDLPAAAG